MSIRTWTSVVAVAALLAAAKAAPDAATAKTEAPPAFGDPVLVCQSTTAPAEIMDDYWRGEFERVNREVAAAKGTQVVFFGDSITLGWTMLKGLGKQAWEERFAQYRPINMGNSGDITPVMLYRVTHGNLDFPEGEAPRVAVLLCGTNNYGVNQSAGGKEKWDLGMHVAPAEVAEGVRAIAQAFRRELPTTRVLILGILPCKQPEKWQKVQETNRILATIAYPKDEVVFMDLAKHFTNGDGSLKADLYTDGTHLTAAGYAAMAEAIAPEIARLVGLGGVAAKD